MRSPITTHPLCLRLSFSVWRFFTLLVFLLLFQPQHLRACLLTLTVSQESATAPGEEVCVSIVADGFTDVLAMQFDILIDTAQLDFQDMIVLAPGLEESLSSQISSGNIRFSWSDDQGVASTLPDGTILYELCFTTLAENDFAQVAFSPDYVLEIYSGSATLIPTLFLSGGVHLGPGPHPQLNWTNYCQTTSNCQALSVNPVGGQAPYTYAWTGPDNFTSTLPYIPTGSPNGFYDLLVTDANGTTTTALVGPIESTWGFHADANLTDDDCDNPGTGAIDITPNNGFPPYTFLWSNGATTEDLTNLDGGTYTLTITDDNGCTTVSTWEIELLNPDVDFSILETPANCLGGLGAIDLSVNDAGNYSFAWSNGATTEDLDDLMPGYYTVILTDTNSGCTDTGEATIISGEFIPTYFYNCDPNTGEAELFVDNGMGDQVYTFEWSTGAVTTGTLTSSINGLTEGAYSVTVTGQDSGCSAVIDPININCQGGSPTSACVQFIASHEGSSGPGDEVCVDVTTRNFNHISSFQYAMTWNANVLDFVDVTNEFDIGLQHNNTSAEVAFFSFVSNELDGNTLPDEALLYQICFSVVGSTGSSSAVSFDGNILFFETTQELPNTIPNLIPTSFWSGSVVSDGSPNNTLSLAGGCAGGGCGGTGQLDLTIGGGQPPYAYNWAGPNGFSATTEDIDQVVTPGSYYLTVTDDAGAVLYAAFQSENGTLAVIGSVTNDDGCTATPDGNIVLAVNGGVSPYTYEWSNGEAGADISDLNAGVYTVTVTDVNGCVQTASYTVEEDDLALTVQSDVDHPDCNITNGSIALTVPGNPDDFTFEWSTGATTNVISDLPEGMYTVTISEVNGNCEAVKTYGLIELELSLSTGYECNLPGGAELAAVLWNNNELFAFEWSTGEIVYDSLYATIDSLANGNYGVTVTGQTSGCTVVVDPVVVDCTPPVISDCFALITQSTNANSGEQICVPITTQGFANIWGIQFSMSWDPTVLDFSNVQNFAFPNLGVSNFGADFTDSGILAFSWVSQNMVTGDDLSDGSTFFEVCFDVVGAVGTSSAFRFSEDMLAFEVIDVSGVFGFNGVNAQVHVDDTTVPVSISALCGTGSGCSGSNTGSVDVAVDGGYLPYTFTWTDEVGTVVSTSEDLAGVPAGAYFLEVLDANGTAVDVVVNLDPSVIEIGSSTVTNLLCNDDGSGGINLDVSSDWMPLTFAWSNGADTEDISNLQAGAYTLTATDASGCALVETFFVSEPTPIDIAAAHTCPSAAGGDGAFDVTVTGGTGGYAFAWSNGATQQNISGLANGTYTLTVTDFNACSTMASYYVGDCVWPGDTDTSGLVNNFDLLNIGLGFGATGPARSNASIAWMGQPADEWAGSTPNSMVNYKHIDTDGNGTINNDDTLAIVQNWGETHNLTGSPDHQFTDLPPADGSVVVIPFFIQPDTFQANTTAALPIMLGDIEDVVVDLYGLAFSITFDPEVIVPGSAYLVFDDSWVGDNNSDLIALQRTFYADGRIDVGMTRTDGNNISGEGKIASLFITIEDDIVLHGGDDNRTVGLIETQFGIENVLLITNQEEEILANPMTTIVLIQSIETGTEDGDAAAVVIDLYPNPVAGQLHIDSPEAALTGVVVYDVLGRLLYEYEYAFANKAILNTSGWDAGTYLAKVQTDQGAVIRRIIVMKN